MYNLFWSDGARTWEEPESCDPALLQAYRQGHGSRRGAFQEDVSAQITNPAFFFPSSCVIHIHFDICLSMSTVLTSVTLR